MFMMYFAHSFLTTVSAAIAAVFRMILLQEYKGTNVISCVIVTPYQLKIIIISIKML